MPIYWSHITGVKVLLIAERGLLLVIMIATDVGGRDTEREMKNPQPLQSLFQQFQHRDHRSRTRHQVKNTDFFSCPFMAHFSAAAADSVSAYCKYYHCLWMQQLSRVSALVCVLEIQQLSQTDSLLLLSQLIFLFLIFGNNRDIHSLQFCPFSDFSKVLYCCLCNNFIKLLNR